MDNEIDYLKCTRNAPKFLYIHKVFFGLSLNIKYLCKYFFGIKQLRITLLPNKILRDSNFFLNKLIIWLKYVDVKIVKFNPFLIIL